MEVKFRTLENHMHSTKNGGDPKLNNTMGGEKSDKQGTYLILVNHKIYSFNN